MTPQTRAAHDRIQAYLNARTTYEQSLGPAARHGYADETIDKQITRIPLSELDRPDIVPLAPTDLRTVLAALDHYEAIEESVRESARQVAEEVSAHFGPVPDRILLTQYELGPKPYGHPWHACGSCSRDGMHPGNGCINCRRTGFDQTPCLTCADDPASRIILGRISDTDPAPSNHPEGTP